MQRGRPVRKSKSRGGLIMRTSSPLRANAEHFAWGAPGFLSSVVGVSQCAKARRAGLRAIVLDSSITQHNALHSVVRGSRTSDQPTGPLQQVVHHPTRVQAVLAPALSLSDEAAKLCGEMLGASLYRTKARPSPRLMVGRTLGRPARS